jgi:hypothetical protein
MSVVQASCRVQREAALDGMRGSHQLFRSIAWATYGRSALELAAAVLPLQAHGDDVTATDAAAAACRVAAFTFRAEGPEAGFARLAHAAESFSAPTKPMLLATGGKMQMQHALNISDALMADAAAQQMLALAPPLVTELPAFMDAVHTRAIMLACPLDDQSRALKSLTRARARARTVARTRAATCGLVCARSGEPICR